MVYPSLLGLPSSKVDLREGRRQLSKVPYKGQMSHFLKEGENAVK